MSSRQEVEKAWNDYETRRAGRKAWTYQRREIRKALRSLRGRVRRSA